MTHATTWILGFMPVIPFVSFSWAVHAHFTRLGAMHQAMQLLAVSSLLSLGSYVVRLVTRSAEPGLASCLPGAILFATATGLFWWAIAATCAIRLHLAYSANANATIVSSGPFKLVRHPFYLSYMLFWIGTAVVAGGWQWIPALILVAWYASIARSEERCLSTGKQAARYGAYRRRTGMFVPALLRRP